MQPKKALKYHQIFNSDILTNDISIPIESFDKNCKPENLMIVNFNYTNTITSKYAATPEYQVNHIHGVINDKLNPIIFGFGDEIDGDYKKLEDEKKTGFLDFVKSFGYLETSNYYDLVRFISSDIFQVSVIGHSCGLSDRTMLSMIFKHEKCRSIKIYYFGSKEKNNHNDLTKEISRHFTNKTKMRERIVPENQLRTDAAI